MPGTEHATPADSVLPRMDSGPGPRLAAVILGLVALAVWSSSFAGVFVFDDLSAIVDNPTIRSLWTAWQPRQTDLTVSGRPFLNFTLAVSHALSGGRPWGYHAVNLAIHLLAGLTLFGIVRRTLGGFAGAPPGRALPVGRDGPASRSADATLLAFVAALLWLLHPLQTEAVTYLIQRAESLMGLLFLLTLYCFIRAIDSPRSWMWRGGAVGACLLGAATKEVSAVAPLVVLLFDRTFVAGTFREAWRRRWPLHLALLSSWLLLAWLVAGTGWSRGGTAGFGLGVNVGAYWLTQAGALARYLALAFWPHPLVADYGMALVRSAGAVWPQGLLVLALLGGTAAALWRRPVLGFLGAWFFAILAPTSLVPVATQTMAEHRLYLPLGAVLVLAAVAAHRLAGRAGLLALLALAPALGWLTWERNGIYASERLFWSDVAARCPANARAYINLGNLSFHQGRLPGAIADFETALRLQPDLPETESNLCSALTQAGRPGEAVPHGEAALRLAPQSTNAHLNLGNAFMNLDRTADAITQYQAALRLQPDAADIRENLGTALLRAGRVTEAIAQFEAALRLEPSRAETEYALAAAFLRQGDTSGARRHYAAAIALKPDFVPARRALGDELAREGRFAEAVAQLREVVRLAPQDLGAWNNLGTALLSLGRLDDATAVYEAALRLRPDDPTIRENLRLVRSLHEEMAPAR